MKHCKKCLTDKIVVVSNSRNIWKHVVIYEIKGGEDITILSLSKKGSQSRKELRSEKRRK